MHTQKSRSRKTAPFSAQIQFWLYLLISVFFTVLSILPMPEDYRSIPEFFRSKAFAQFHTLIAESLGMANQALFATQQGLFVHSTICVTRQALTVGKEIEDCTADFAEKVCERVPWTSYPGRLIEQTDPHVAWSPRSFHLMEQFFWNERGRLIIDLFTDYWAKQGADDERPRLYFLDHRLDLQSTGKARTCFSTKVEAHSVSAE